jgi:Tol biopolymer transport system component
MHAFEIRTRPKLIVVALGFAATLALSGVAGPAQAAFPGTNGVVAFERKDGAEDFEIYNVSPGGGEGPLTTNSVDDRTPAYSPDGNKIAFVRGAGVGRDIWVMDANGANEVQRTSAAGADLDPTWSPDGTRIAYSAQGTLSKDIFVINADGSGSPVPLTTDASGDETNPAWSPDGSRLAFESPRDGNADLWVRTLSSGAEANLTNTAVGVSNTDPAWSPDGRRLAFTQDATHREIFTLDTCSGVQANISLAPTNPSDVRPAFSPDGSQVVWASNRDGNVELWTASSSGGGPMMITDTLAAQSNAPDWQADVAGPPAGPVACGGGGTAVVADTVAPVLTSFSLSRRKFAAFPAGGSIARKTPRGTGVSFRVTEAGKAVFKIERALKGRKRGKKCVAPTRKNRKAKRCTRYRRLKGSFTYSGKPGLNRFRFTGRLRGKKLRPGRYRLVNTVTDAAGNKSKPRRVKFRIVPRGQSAS